MRYAFADCVLDTRRRALYRGARTINMRPKVFQVLTFLIEHRDRVVSKDELFDECWAGRVVGEATLNSCLKEIRRAIGDSGREQKHLRTLHGHGYHFVAPLKPEPPAVPASGEQRVPESEPESSRSGVDREFKPVSVLACAVRNADELVERIGPEQMDAVMRRLFAAAGSILARYGGTVTERVGDGFTAFFGAPQAFEDHARRAVLAAIELMQAVRVESGDAPAIPLGIGLHTGRVVVGSFDGSDRLFSAAGRATRLTHRIRDAAGDSILASEPLYRLIEAEVDGEAVDPVTGTPRLFAIRKFSALRGGVPQRTARARSTFVGRNDEIAIVRKRLQMAADGTGQVVCVIGEPGIGKSRLLQELTVELAAEPFRCLQANCLAYRQASPYFPLLQLLRAACCLTPSDPHETVIDRLRARAVAARMDEEDAVPLLLRLLGAPVDAAGVQSDLPQSGVEKVFSHASRFILHDESSRPLFIAIEDVHWIDATTEQWLASFVPRITGAPVLLLVTHRRGYQSGWTTHSHVTQLSLPRLNDSDSAALVASLAAPITNSNTLTRRVINNAQGNPFFLEELTFNLVDRDPDAELDVPTTVEAVIASRIDQLDPLDKSLLQTAAVIGTPVPLALLRAVAADAAQDIDESIQRLERGEFIYEDTASTSVQYLFKHALTQEVAHQSLLEETRRERHRQIAEACERHFAQLVKMQPELAARHFTEAGIYGKAMDYWHQAGARAVRQSANPEAVAHFEQALVVSESLPRSPAIKRQQLDIYLKLGPPLMSSQAFTSPTVEAAYQKARQLCDDVGTRSDLLIVLWGLWLHYAHRGLIDKSRPLAQQIYRIAEEVGDEALTLQAHHAIWSAEIWHGELELCHEHARAGLRLYDRDSHRAHRFLFGGHDPGVCAFGTAAVTAWFLGRPDEALRLTHQGAELAMALDHPYSRIITMHDFMVVETLRGNFEAAGRYGTLAVDTCTRQRVPNYLAVGHIYAGYAAAATGDFESGMAQLQDGLERYRELGAQRLLASYLLLLADLCLSPERCEPGIAAVNEAAELVETTGEIRWAPETKRLKGELLLARSSGNRAEAEALFIDALESAAAQDCKSFELRAATSLAASLNGAGDPDCARRVLKPVHDVFTEGFETRDLERAGALLRELD